MTQGFTVDSKELAPALTLALTAMDTKERIPMLSYVMLEADGATLAVTGASTSRSVTVEIDARVGEQAFSACVPGQAVLNLVRSYDSLITFKQHDERWVTVTGEGSRHRLPSEPRNGFILVDRVERPVATVEGKLLAAMLTAAGIAAETNPFGEARWKALEWQGKDGVLTITGCNGPMLSSVEVGCDGEFYALVPEASVRLIAGMATKAEMVMLHASERLLTAVGGNVTMTTQLAHAAWPDWRMLLVGEREHVIIADSEAITTAMRRALLADDPDKPRLTMEFTADNLTMTCTSQRSESREVVAIRGNGNVIAAINGGPMLKFLKSVSGDVRWELGAPMRLAPVESSAFSWRYLQLPLVEGR